MEIYKLELLKRVCNNDKDMILMITTPKPVNNN